MLELPATKLAYAPATTMPTTLAAWHELVAAVGCVSSGSASAYSNLLIIESIKLASLPNDRTKHHNKQTTTTTTSNT